MCSDAKSRMPFKPKTPAFTHFLKTSLYLKWFVFPITLFEFRETKYHGPSSIRWSTQLKFNTMIKTGMTKKFKGSTNHTSYHQILKLVWQRGPEEPRRPGETHTGCAGPTCRPVWAWRAPPPTSQVCVSPSISYSAVCSSFIVPSRDHPPKCLESHTHASSRDHRTRVKCKPDRVTWLHSLLSGSPRCTE